MNSRYRALGRIFLLVVAVVLLLASFVSTARWFYHTQQTEAALDQGQKELEALEAREIQPTVPEVTTTTSTTLPPTTTVSPTTEPETTTTTAVTTTTTSTTTTTTIPIPTPQEVIEPNTVFGDMTIPCIGLVDAPLVEGDVSDVDKLALDKGVAHRAQRPFPGEGGNTVFTAHRTSHGGLFYDLDKVQEGCLIEQKVAYDGEWHNFVYSVELVKDMVPASDKVEVSPGVTEAQVFVDEYFGKQAEHETITLAACTPKGSISHRIVVLGRLIQVDGRDV